VCGRLLLWDCDGRCYSYYVDVSNNQQNWTRVVNKTTEACRSWQTIFFDRQPVTFVRIVGTHNTANEVNYAAGLVCFSFPVLLLLLLLYYYCYRKKRFRWHNVRWLQEHITNTKQNSTSATQQNEQSICQIQTAAELSKSGKLWANSSVFSWRLKDASEDNYVRDAGKLFHVRAAATGKARSPTLCCCINKLSGIMAVILHYSAEFDSFGVQFCRSGLR